MTSINLSLHDILLEHFGESIRIPVTVPIEELFDLADEDELTVDVDHCLAQHHTIAFTWHIDDVKQQRPDLDDEQCWQVLKECRQHHNATIGMNWDVIDCVADMLFGSAPEDADCTENRHE